MSRRKKISSMTGCAAGLLLATTFSATLLAETITIGRGSGIVWEGLPFNITLSGPMLSARGPNTIFSLGPGTSSCMLDFTTISGIKTITMPSPFQNTLGLVPRLTVTGRFTRFDGQEETFSGTVGLPDTQLTNHASGASMLPIGFEANTWCFSPYPYTLNNSNNSFYSVDGLREVTISGNWAIVASGGQGYYANEITLPTVYYQSYSNNSAGSKSVPAFPPTTLRISNLQCVVSTPTTIDFGSLSRDIHPYALLGSQSRELTTTCTQTSNRINANIHLQFRAVNGLYEGNPTRLALDQGHGYITGEIDNGVTGSGDCAATSGLRFDNTPVKVGEISNAQGQSTASNQVTWRLCSGGSNLPTGNVTASTEMLVTFN